MGKHTGTESIRFRGYRYAGGMAVILQRVMFLWREKRRRDYGMQNLSYRRNWK